MSEILQGVTLRDIRVVEEVVDPQYGAIKALSKSVEPVELVRLTVANALVSYQLSGPGEDWWREFSRYFRERRSHSLEELARLLPRSRNNRRLLRQKLRRLRRIRPFLEELTWEDIETYYLDMVKFWRDLASNLGSRLESKTITFAVKMFGYAVRAVTGEFRPYPFEIPIPVDSRIERVTRKITDEDPRSYWRSVALRTGIPPLHLDSILWLGTSRDQDVRRTLVETVPKLVEVVNRILRGDGEHGANLGNPPKHR